VGALSEAKRRRSISRTQKLR